jgi:hypothetical protein
MDLDDPGRLTVARHIKLAKSASELKVESTPKLSETSLQVHLERVAECTVLMPEETRMALAQRRFREALRKSGLALALQLLSPQESAVRGVFEPRLFSAPLMSPNNLVTSLQISLVLDLLFPASTNVSKLYDKVSSSKLDVSALDRVRSGLLTDVQRVNKTLGD